MFSYIAIVNQKTCMYTYMHVCIYTIPFHCMTLNYIPLHYMTLNYIALYKYIHTSVRILLNISCNHATYIYEGCSKFFHLENAIFAKKNFFRRTFANSMFIFRGTCWPRFLRKTWTRDILKLFQPSDPLSHFILRQLHLNIYVLL